MKTTSLISLASFLLLVTGTDALAQSTTLYTVEYTTDGSGGFTIGAAGALQGVASPSQLLFGTLPSGARAGEVAVAQGVLNPGDLVPLPKYADGAEALESEIFWTAQLWQAKFPTYWYRQYSPAFSVPNGLGDRVTIGFSGRTYGGGYSILAPYFFPSQETRDISVAVTVIAVRQSGTTAQRPSTFGSVKVGGR